MKKRFLLLFILLLIPVSYAKLSITNTINDYYNLGDSISSSISIVADNDISGMLKLVLKCGNQSIDYYIIPVELKMNQQKDIEVPSRKVSSAMIGECLIDVSLKSNSEESLDNINSKTFSVTDVIEVISSLNKKTILPGEKLILQGEIKPSFDDEIKNAKLDIKLDDILVAVEFNGLKFSYETTLSKIIKSGEHNIEINLNDSFGNNGNTKDGFYVTPVQKRLELNLNKTNFKPEEIVEIKPLLYDQAGDLIAESLLIKIYNPKKEVFSGESIDGIQFTIPKHSIPGAYKINVKSSKLKTESSFNVGKVKALSAAINGQILELNNIGNVNYDKLEISFAGENSFVEERKIYLKPAESGTIDLGELADSGKYTVNVLGNSFENVSIIGKAKFNFNILYWILTVLLVIALLFVWVIRIKGKGHKDRKHKREFEKGRSFREKLNLKRPVLGDDNSNFRRRMLMENEKKEAPKLKIKPKGQYFEIMADEGSNIESNEEYKIDNEGKNKNLFNMFD